MSTLSQKDISKILKIKFIYIDFLTVKFEKEIYKWFLNVQTYVYAQKYICHPLDISSIQLAGHCHIFYTFPDDIYPYLTKVASSIAVKPHNLYPYPY